MTALATTRTLIIEGQALFAKALAHVLQLDPTIQVVGDANALSDSFVREVRPDLILIDLDGVGAELKEDIMAARRVVPTLKVGVFSTHVVPDVMQRALNAGADGYIVTDVTPREFLRAVHCIAAGDSYVDPRIAGRMLRRSATRQKDPLDLSAREHEVVTHIVGGLSNKEISYKMSLSEKTVKNHVSRIFSKFDCTARTQVAVHAIRSGLV